MIKKSDPAVCHSANEILSEQEKDFIKLWVNEHFIANAMVEVAWHPYVKKEWEKAQKRFELEEQMKKLDRESQGE